MVFFVMCAAAVFASIGVFAGFVNFAAVRIVNCIDAWSSVKMFNYVRFVRLVPACWVPVSIVVVRRRFAATFAAGLPSWVTGPVIVYEVARASSEI